ncbi:hypothetical protein V8C35DRAFT_297709 [Trichoderma chlorosporum]
MLDDLARNPHNVAEYQDSKSSHCQMFAFVSHGSQWAVYVTWSSLETCNVEELWCGDVTNAMKALELTCIVDQIHDYAVRYHRRFVLNHLTSWLNWSEEPENNRPLALLESLLTEKKTWRALEYEMSQLRREKLRQTREQKKKLDEPARVARSSKRQEAESTSDTILDGRVTKRVTRRQGRRTRKSREAE